MESERLANQLQAINTEIETRLKPDLDVVCGLRDRVFEEIMEILQLKQNIETIRDNQDKNVELQVDMGENIYVQAEVPDCSRIYVNFGLGVWVDLEPSEALKFIEMRHRALEERSERYTGRISEIQAHLVPLLHGARELESLLA
uniref:Prefoldin subunit 3 n=1 Tax=Rhodosorus marinus TaxID=101924 RepID=A0A7S3ELG5_9RHOD|mmetsp:Transcript_4502/g.19266  ORF Transcript_4502/g.19266 Transcript_4502/m.19266 type:complete len:144 (+) Transcript_4502:193-624(+)